MNLTKITSTKEKNIAKPVTKFKIKAEIITTMQKYQTMKHHIMILITMMTIRMITKNITMTMRAIRIMNLMLMNLKMIIIVIQMILIKVKKMLL